jgi:hypothetical protein
VADSATLRRRTRGSRARRRSVPSRFMHARTLPCIASSLALLLAGCPAPEVPVDAPSGDAARPDAPTIDGGCLPECPLALPSFSVTNPSAEARTEVLRVSLPLPRGNALADALDGWSVEGSPAELVPLKWHYDPETGARSSLAIVQLRVRATLEAGEERILLPTRDGASVPPYVPGTELAAWRPGAAEDARVELELADGTALSAPLFGGSERIVEAGELGRTLRHRLHFTDGAGTPSPLALTVYAAEDAGLDQGELVVLVGNDTLEQPIGGIRVRRISLRARAPFRFALRDPGAYGVAPPAAADEEVWPLVSAETELADGASFVFRGRWAVTADRSGTTHASFRAAVAHRLFPLAGHEDWRRSGAAGPYGYLPEARETEEARRAAVAIDCARAFTGSPVSHLGYLNQNPPSTGDQPDFGSAVPTFYREAVEAASPCPLRPAALAVDREALRPSFYWMTRDGAEERVRTEDFPTLFFWSGRMHFDPSWNPDQPAWLPRARPFTAGEGHGWGGMDDQHYGNNALRAVYELTGDPYLRELLVAHQALVTWLFFTDYAPNLGAERSMRLMEEAIALYAVEDDTPSAAQLREGAIAKNRLVLDAVEERLLRVSNPSYGVVMGDARVTGAFSEPPAADAPIVMAWQTGFHMEFQSLAMRHGWDPATARAIAAHYLDAAELFFLPDGTPVTYFVEADPTRRALGGISPAWWSGWVQVADALPEHPGATLVGGPVRDQLCPLFAPPAGMPFDPDQRWESYGCP